MPKISRSFQTVGERHRDQVNVVGHEAVGPDLDPMLPAPLGHEFHVGRIVSLAKKTSAAGGSHAGFCDVADPE